MPSRKGHEWVDKVLGLNPEVDASIDLPFLFAGRGHRKYFHTPEEAFWKGYFIDGIRGGVGGMMHVATDETASSDRMVKAFIELASRMKSTGGTRTYRKPLKKGKIIAIR